ncbi:WD repeat protein [Aspergillus tanneri]|uniref:WD repeat-containing protein 89 n=1 Tax=Aspergillus tanneri TaxID=1220188 RepID=A0A5M9N3N4_9EURO|nr:WD repeat-containing protein 89 [Aspergillus tanneri]KAA8651619.1 WD repeat-containing protein 89 [Aspergillus tanneri]
MHTLKTTASSSLALAEGSYIYSIAASSPGSFAAISSDDSLRMFDAAGLNHVSVVAANTHEGVTSLKSYDVGQQLLATGGRDGKVKLWDLRKGKNAAVVVAMETWMSDHPGSANFINIYNTTITDEDDALVQVINHGSVHHAGFLTERTIYALSHDEVFSIHPATDPDEQTQEPDPVQFGDLRQPLGCEYIAQLCIGSQGPYVAAGSTSDRRLDLVPLVSNPSWHFDQENLWRLPGGHGEEIVRSVYLDEQSQSVFTCGEDGFVRAWKPDDDKMEMEESSTKTPRPKAKKGRDKGRFNPY